jgi:hypothetical protein
MKKIINITMKGLAALLIACIMAGTVAYIKPAEEVQAASKKVTRLAFIKGVVDAMTGQECSDGHELTFTKNSDGSIEAGEITKKKYSKSDIAKLAKKYKVETADAQYIACAMAYGIITKSTFKSVKSKITVAAAGIILAKADRTIRIAERRYTDEQIKEGMSMIADIKKIKKASQRKLFTEAYMDGYFFGKKTGDYVDARKLSPTSKLTAKTAKSLYAMVKDTSKRYQLSPHYQMLRNTKKNLPKNKECYAYILDSYPNAYYETGWHAMEYQKNTWFDMREDGVTPKGIGAGTLEQRLVRQFGPTFVYPYEMDEYFSMETSDDWRQKPNRSSRSWDVVSQLRESSIEFYELALNVNYKTIKDDKKWQEKMLKYMSQEQIDSYIETCIKNKTIIECDKVSADESGAYWFDGHPYLKIYAHVKITSDAHIEDASHWDDEKYGNLFAIIRGYDSDFMSVESSRQDFYRAKYKKGEWFDFFTVTEGANPAVDKNRPYALAGTYSCTSIMADMTGLYKWLLPADY